MLRRHSFGIDIYVIVLLIFLWIKISISDSDTDAVDDLGLSYVELTCIRHCYTEERRQCVRAPDQCGGCVDNHVSVDGVCRARSMAVAESVPSVKRQLDEALERQRKKVETRSEADLDSMSDGSKTVNAQTKDTGGGASPTNPVIDDAVFIGVIAAFCSAAVIGIIVAIICYCKMRKSAKEVSDMDYSSYGSSLAGSKSGNDGYPTKPPTVDRKLAQSAQMFHYQHQKQQMLEMEKAQEVAAKSDEEITSEDDNGDDHYTVYECPGLASTGEMEVRNPLYMEDSPLPPPSYSSTPPPPLVIDPPPPESNYIDPHPASLINGHSTDKH